MVNDFFVCFVLSDYELIFIWDVVEISLVLVLMFLSSDFAFDCGRHPRVTIGLGLIFPFINHLEILVSNEEYAFASNL